MVKYLVIGAPVGHSRSPEMQNAAFEACGLGTPYGKRHVDPEELPAFFDYARKNLDGVNLTVPHKTQAAQLADELTPRAAECGSVNTLIIRNGHILGDSTDGVGLQRALEYCFQSTLCGKRILFCGAGGAARATAVHLTHCGVTEISFINRTLSKAEELIGLCKKSVPEITAECASPQDSNAVKQLLSRADFLVQATSLGLKEDDPAPFPLEYLAAGMKLKIFDTIYHPTALQNCAAKLGLACCNGKEMLIRQGAESFELWTGLSAPLEKMRIGFDRGECEK